MLMLTFLKRMVCPLTFENWLLIKFSTIKYWKRNITSNDLLNGNSDCFVYVPDKRHEQNFSSVESIKMEFDFRRVVLASTISIGYALVLAKK